MLIAVSLVDILGCEVGVERVHRIVAAEAARVLRLEVDVAGRVAAHPGDGCPVGGG